MKASKKMGRQKMKQRKVISVMLTIIVLSGLVFIGSFAFGQLCPPGMVGYWRADGDATDSYDDHMSIAGHYNLCVNNPFKQGALLDVQ